MNIMDFIPFGKENAIGRFELMDKLNLPDRKVRQHIEEARKRGEIIINDQDGRGYYTSDRLEDLQKQLNANHRRAMSILVQQKHLKRKIEELEGSDQITTEEVADIG